MSEKIELKSCPFCGEKTDIVVVEKIVLDEGDSPEDYTLEDRVECQNCGALGPTADHRTSAREAWNRRDTLENFSDLNEKEKNNEACQK